MRKLLLALLLASVPVWAQIQGWASGQSIQGGGTTPSVTLTSCAAHGAYLVVALVTETANGSATGVTMGSTTSMTWHHGTGAVVNNNAQAIWWAYSSSLTNAETVTATGNIWNAGITAQCFSGTSATPQDQQAVSICSNGDIITNSCQTGSVTPTQGGELIVAGAYYESGQTAPTGFTPSVSCTSAHACMAYEVQAAPVTINPQFSYAWSYADINGSTMTFLAAAPAVDYSVSGPSGGPEYAASSNFTVTKASGTFSGSMAIALSDGSKGGTITPSVGQPGTSSVTVTPPSGSTSFSFTYTPTTLGAITLSFTGAGMTGNNPPSMGYASSAPSMKEYIYLGGRVIAVENPVQALSVATGSLPNGQVGTAYSTSLQASGGTQPYTTWTKTAGSLPAGITLASSGVLSGTPTASGTFSGLVFQVTDSAGATASSAQLTLTVTAATLAVSTASLPNGQVGTAYSTSLQASGGTQPYTTWTKTAGSLPGGITLNSSGVLSGTPTASGTFGNLVFQVTDSAGATASSAQLTLTVAAASLTVSTPPLPGGTTGSLYSAPLAANGGQTPYTWSVTSGSLPAGLNVTPTQDGTAWSISGTPTAVGSSTFTLQVSDAFSPPHTATQGFTIVIAATLGITTASLPNGAVGTLYPTTNLGATGGTGSYSWSVTPGTLPAGLNLSTSGSITGTPTAAGVFPITVQVQDSGSPQQTKTKSLSISILGITTTQLPTGQVGTNYTATLAATGGVSPYAWELTSGSLLGIALGAGNGQLNGTPTTSCTSCSVTFRVTDNNGTTASATLTLTVAPASLAIGTAPFPTGTVGNTYSAPLTATGGQTPYAWSVTSGSLPAGLNITLKGTAWSISGTPTAAGSSNFTLQVSDAFSPPHTATQGFTIVIAATLGITTASLPNGAVGTLYPTTTLGATGGSGTYTWSVSAGTLPAGLQLLSNLNVWTISGTPTTAGTFTFTIQVSDSSSPPATATKSFTISILGITTTQLPGGSTSAAYSATLAAIGGQASYTWSVISGTLPPGLTLSGGGVISGNPTATGTFTFMVQVQDGSSPALTATKTLSIAILGITTTQLPDGTQGRSYPSTTLAVSGGQTPYIWGLASGSTLPSGLVLSQDGKITGTPTTAGTFNFTVQVQDASSPPLVATKALSIVIWTPVTILPTSLPGGTTGTSYPVTTLTASGGDGGTFTWLNTGAAIVPGLSLSSSGVIQGTPSTAGTYTFSVTATDSHLHSGTQTYTVAVSQGFTVSSSTPEVYGGQTATLTATIPVNWTLSPSVGTLSTAGPSSTVVYTAPSNLSTSQYVTITGQAGGVSVPVTLLLVPPIPSLLPANGTLYTPGQPVLFTMSAPESDGWASSNDYLILDVSSTSGYAWPNACNVQYQAVTRTVFLTLDNGTTWASGALGSATVLSNSQCSVNLAGGTQSVSGFIQTVSLPVTFSPTFTGIKSIWVLTYEGTLDANWFGSLYSFTVTPATATLSANLSQQFTATTANDANATFTWSMSPQLGTLSGTGLYTAPATISGQQSVTITATYYDVAPAKNFSASAAVTLQGSQSTVATPTFSPNPSGGPYSPGQLVTIGTTTSGASIRYTTNGTTPTETAGTLYTGPVAIAATTTFKAIAYEAGWTDSAIAPATYTVSSGSNGYSYYRSITINHTSVPNTDQANFPVLISGVYSYLASSGNGGQVQNANGYDIVFSSDVAGTNLLSFEREKYVATTGEVDFWVKIPTLSHTADTTIYMWYGNGSVTTDTSTPTQVWDSNFKGVWHLPNGSGSLSLTDSTGNNSAVNSGASATTGSVDGGAGFGGSAHVDLGASTALNFTSPFTISFWTKYSSIPASFEYILDRWSYSNGSYRQWSFDNEGLANSLYFRMSTDGTDGGTQQIAYSGMAAYNNTWVQVTGEWNGSMVTLFVNGVSAATASIGGIVSTGGQHTYVGGGDNGTVVPYVGMIDEIRMSNTVRSADWITTEYRNQSSPSTFYSVGSASPGGAVTVSVLPTSVTLLPSQSQPFTATVTGTSNTAVTWSIAPTGIGTFNTSNGTYTAPATQAASQVLTVKATSVADNSKFATATVTLPGPPQPPAVTSVTPSSGTELAQVFAATFSDNVGYQDITEADLLVQTSQTQAAACSAKWTPTGGYYLMNDAGTAWLGPVAAGGSGILQNSQCMLMAAVPAISGSGNNLTVNFGMVFSPTAFTGAKNVYLAATGSGGNSGLQQKGSVTVGAASQLPQNVSASPLGQTGTSQTFAFTVSSPNGFQYSGWLEALFNSELVGPKGCFLYYWAPSQTLELASDDASTWSTGAIGSSGTLQNSQCQVNLQSSTVTQGPNSLTLNVALTFLPALPGPQQVMMQAVDDAGNWANWQTMGTWTTTPVQPGNPAFVSGSPLLGTGMTQTFTYVVSSVNGYTYMRSVQAMFGAGAIYPIPNCYVNYDRLTNQITLLGNSGVWDGTQQSTAMGTGSPINNSQCTVNPAQSSATGSGNNLTVSLNLTFSSSWLGGKNNYLYMYDRGGNQLGWVTVGTWTVGTSPTSGYGNHRAITINHANVPNTDQSNFPVLISGTYSYLANTANGGKLRNANGYDIVFSSDAAGMNLLSFEREKYVATTGEVEFWVKIPTLSHSADTTIYMWYGNASVSADTAAPAQVWDANFKGVWHLANGSTLSGADSTSNGNNGSLVNSPSATAGQIDGGANFNAASSQYITMGNTLNIGATDFTISYWINNPASAQYAAVVSKRNCGGVPYCMYITGQGYVDSGGSGHAAQTVFFFGIGASGPFQSYHTTNNVVDGNWHYVTVARRSGVVAIYVDGANMALTADAANTSSLDFTNPGTFNIGNGASYENGKVDEVRVSPALARSADWIATEYSNQRSPSTFYSVGNEN